MSRINLLPVEFRRARANAVRARRIGVVGVALGVLLAGLYGIRTWQVMSLRSELERARADRAAVETQIASYADLVAQQQTITYAKGVVTSLLVGEVSWSEQMLKLASTVPTGFTLTSVSGSMSMEATQPVVGSLTWSAKAATYGSAETWLVRLGAQEGWANGWIGSAQSAEGGITATGSVDLTLTAVTTRGGGPA